MPEKIFNKTKWVSAKKYATERDIAVRIVCPSPEAKASPFCEVELVKEYEQETRVSKPLNVVQCIAVGAMIGLLLCTAASAVGLKLSYGDIAAIISVPAIVGLIAGFLIL